MADDFNNQSFETPGAEPGLALAWTPVIVSSLEEFAVYSRGDSVVVVDTLPATDLLGVQITVNPDGSITLLIAAGSLTAFEDFEFAWDANQLYFFTFVSGNLEAAAISGTKSVENFEDGWGEDDLFTVKTGATTTVIPTNEGGMTVNAFAGYILNVGGEQRTVLSNTATTFTLSAALSLTPTAGLSLRLVGGETASELLADLSILLTETASFDAVPEGKEDFEEGWGVDDLFTLASINGTLTVLTVFEVLPIGLFATQTIDVAGQRRTVVSNTATTITLSSAIAAAPPVGASIRITGSGDETTTYKASFDALLLGSFDDAAGTPFVDGLQFGAGEYANEIKVRLFRAQPAPLNELSAKGGLGFAISPNLRLTYTVPPGTVIDPVLGTLLPARLTPVFDSNTTFDQGINDLLSAVDLQPSGKFDIVGGPGLDVERYQFTTAGSDIGREAFEQGWKVDNLFLTDIANIAGNFTSAGFTRVNLGNIDLNTNVFTNGATTSPAVGTEIVLSVREGGTGVAGSDPSVNLVFLDKFSVVHAAATLFPRLAPEGFEKSIAVSLDGIIDVTAVVVGTPLLTFGVLDIFAPTRLVESFEDSWPPPSPELL